LKEDKKQVKTVGRRETIRKNTSKQAEMTTSNTEKSVEKGKQYLPIDKISTKEW
jgi:hypothetical protein